MRPRPVDILCFNQSLNRQEKECLANIFRCSDLARAEKCLQEALNVADKTAAIYATADIILAKKAIAQLER